MLSSQFKCQSFFYIVKSLLMVSVLVIAVKAFAAPGDLDATFDGDGWVTTNVNVSSNEHGQAVTQQNDGKLVAAGYGNNGDMLLARYNSNGSLDASFDSDGLVATPFGVYGSQPKAIIQQSDGKLLIAGTAKVSFDWVFALVRYNADGSLDSTFDSDGVVTTKLGGNDDVRALIQQSDGKLVAAGFSSGYFSLARYNLNGSLDTSFNGTGKLATWVGTFNTGFNAIIQQTDGKLVAVGGGGNGQSDFGVVRFNNDGSLDSTFGASGKATTDIAGYDDIAYLIFQQPDGKLLVAGQSYDAINNNYHLALVRYNTNGLLDDTFGTNGIIVSAFPTSDSYFKTITRQSDGKFAVLTQPFKLTRYTAYGVLDATFGDAGIATLSDGSLAYSITQQRDGKLVVVGDSTPIGGYKILVARFESGQLDTDGDGVVDWLDTDNDNDAILDSADNCPLNSNADQLNTDGDTQGNACDADDDNDTVLDINDAFPLDVAESVDTDGDGIGNNADSDDDNDGISDTNEINIYHTNPLSADTDHDTLPDKWELDQGRNPLIADYQVSAGNYHTCVLDDNGVRCWGSNYAGQTEVPALVNPKQVSAGYDDVCALDDSGIHCWGANFFDQSSMPIFSNPRQVNTNYGNVCALDDQGVHCRYDDIYKPWLVNPVQVSVGAYNVCAIDSNGVHCWGGGRNDYGQMDVPALVNPRQVSVGAYNACALDDTGVHCWGNNYYGQNYVPVLVNPISVSAGGDVACALDDGSVHCWGGYYSNAVPTLSHPTQVSAGMYHACALDDSGVHCWGNNDADQSTVPALMIDPDGDGIPSWWEVQYGLNRLDASDANGDLDGDGVSNVQEYINGTDPTVSNYTGPLGRISNIDGLNNTDDLVLTGPNLQVWTTSANIVSSYNYIDVLPESGNASLVATPDVNGDGINDMVFQTNGGGNIYTWVMGNSGTTYTGAWLLSTTSLVKGSGDFDNDGDGDLVLQNPSTGDVSIILLQNGLSVAFNWLGTFPTYQVKAVGDVNNDGTDDIILQDPITDDIATLTITTGILLQAKWQERFTNYVVIAMGDANGDGTSDIYTTTSNGDLAVIPMLNGSYTGAYWLGAFTGYVPYAVADVDGDGLSDFVLQDATGNIGSVTLTNTFAIKTAAWVGNWGAYVIKGALDTDGDLDADIVTQDASANVGIIEMENGLSAASRWVGSSANTVTILPKTSP